MFYIGESGGLVHRAYNQPTKHADKSIVAPDVAQNRILGCTYTTKTITHDVGHLSHYVAYSVLIYTHLCYGFVYCIKSIVHIKRQVYNTGIYQDIHNQSYYQQHNNCGQ